MEAAGRADPAVLERLRERIRTLQAAPRQLLSVLRTGLAPVDGLLPGGGFPLGQVVELWGEPASGRARLAFRAIAEAHRALRLAAWVDGPRTLYPPALPPLGVRLEQLLVVRPPEPRQLAWSALQLLRSGAFAAVGLDLTHTGVRLSPPESRGWSRPPPGAGGCSSSSRLPRRRRTARCGSMSPPPARGGCASRWCGAGRAAPRARWRCPGSCSLRAVPPTWGRAPAAWTRRPCRPSSPCRSAGCAPPTCATGSSASRGSGPGRDLPLPSVRPGAGGRRREPARRLRAPAALPGAAPGARRARARRSAAGPGARGEGRAAGGLRLGRRRSARASAPG